jgi:hypothetical protein
VICQESIGAVSLLKSVVVVITEETLHMPSDRKTNLTLCGYTWVDVYSTLNRSIANGDMKRAQRWAAELLCSETGVSRLEAELLAIWAENVGSSLARWPDIWLTAIGSLRNEWIKSGGDNQAFRNNEAIRNTIAECVAYLVVSSKHPRPSLPKSTEVFKEAETVKSRLHGGGAAPDQVSTQRIWDSREDAPTLRTLGNELESAIRTAQTPRALFWHVWILTLDSQKNRPVMKERAPTHIQGKARKNLTWFVFALLSDMIDNGLDSGGCIKQTMECIKLVWVRLGAKNRRDVLGTVITMLCERVKSLSIETRKPQECLDLRPIRTAIQDINTVYDEIANDMKIVPVQGTTETSSPVTKAPGSKTSRTKNVDKQNTIKIVEQSTAKMDKAYSVLRKLYGMDEED